MLLEIGTQIGDYRILSRIGRGAYGIVFEAEHTITRRIDAVKLMLDSGTSSDDEQRFLREIQAQASLQHPNIATVYGAFHTPWGLALAMELVRGKSLRSVFQEGRLAPPRAVELMLPVLAGLTCAERLGVVHRDIKPDNVLITEDGTVKLTDFGLAQVANAIRITTSGENLGTPCYMSPEQVTGDAPADARTDIYSTGVVLYEAVTGRPPFVGSNGFAVMLAHRNSAPVPPIQLEPSIGPELSQVILKALEKDPGQRFQTAAEFATALTQAMMAPAAMPAPRITLRTRNWSVGAAAAALTLAIVGFGAWAGHVTVSRQDPLPAAATTKQTQPVEPPPDLSPATAPAVPVAEPQPEKPPETQHAQARKHRQAKTPAQDPAQALAAPSNLSPFKTPEGARPVPNASPVLPPDAHLTHPPAAVPALPDAIAPPPEPKIANQEPVPPKHHNIVRRAFSHLFGRHPDAVQQPAASAIQPERQ